MQDSKVEGSVARATEIIAGVSIRVQRRCQVVEQVSNLHRKIN